MRLLLEFDESDFTSFEPVPAGVYNARVDASNMEVKQSQNGNDYVTFCYVIEGDEQYAGRKVFDNYTISKKAMWKLTNVLLALGVIDNTTRKFVLQPEMVHNKPCRIKVSQEEYNGKLRNRVDTVMPPEEGSFVKASNDFPF